MKKVLFLILVLSSQVAAQPSLTKDEMKADLSFLVQKIRNVTPGLEVRKQVTGTDILKEIDRLAESEIASFEDFYYTAKRIMLLCQDQHNDLRSYPEGIDEIRISLRKRRKFLTPAKIFSTDIIRAAAHLWNIRAENIFLIILCMIKRIKS